MIPYSASLGHVHPTRMPERQNDLHETIGRSHSVNTNRNIPLLCYADPHVAKHKAGYVND
jgi:hypothetical protein